MLTNKSFKIFSVQIYTIFFITEKEQLSRLITQNYLQIDFIQKLVAQLQLKVYSVKFYAIFIVELQGWKWHFNDVKYFKNSL